MGRTDTGGHCDLPGLRTLRAPLGMRVAAALCASAWLSAPMPAAAQWTGFTSHGTARMAYDPQRIRWEGPVARIWLRIEGAELVEGMTFAISLRDIDCANQASRTERTTGYRDDGSVIGRDSEATPYSPIVPGTMDEDLFRLVCNRQ